MDCQHCEAEAIGETTMWEEGDILSNMEICLCPDCGEDFLFPLAVQF